MNATATPQAKSGGSTTAAAETLSLSGRLDDAPAPSLAEGELLPCPFCGAPAELEHGSDHHGPWFNLGCSRHWGHQRDPDYTNTCIAGRMFYTETGVPKAEAITAWNTRAASEQQ